MKVNNIVILSSSLVLFISAYVIREDFLLQKSVGAVSAEPVHIKLGTVKPQLYEFVRVERSS